MCGWSYQGKPVAVNPWLELLWLPAGMHEGAGYVRLIGFGLSKRVARPSRVFFLSKAPARAQG